MRVAIGTILIVATMQAEPAWAQPITLAQSMTPPDVSAMRDIVIDFETTMKGWLPAAKALARDLLLLLIGIELAVSGAMWGLSRTGLDDFVYRLAIKVFVFALVLKIIQDTGNPSAYFNLEHIPNGFRALAGTITGLPAPYPDDILGMAFDVMIRIMTYAAASSWFFVSFTEMVAVIAIVIIGAAFAAVAIRLFIAILHSILVVVGGLVMIGFAGFRGTAGMADRYVVWAFSVSVKLFFLDMLIGLSQAILPSAFLTLQLNGVLDVLFFPMIALAYAGLVLYIPNAAARVLTEGLNVHLASAIRL